MLNSFKNVLLLLIVPVLSALVNLWARRIPEVWFDEAATMAAIERSPWALPGLLRSIDLVHGAYYYTAQVWAVFFDSTPHSLRAMSVVVFSAMLFICGYLVYSLGRQRRLLAAHLSMLVIATMPSVQWISMEARGYVFTLFFFALALLLIQWQATHQRRSLKFPIAAALLAGVLFSLMFSLVVPLLIALHLLVIPRRTRREVLVVHGVLVGLIVLFALACVGQIGQIGWIAAHDMDMWDNITRRQFFVGSGDDLPHTHLDIFATYLAQGIVVLLAGFSVVARLPWAGYFLACVVLPTCALTVVHLHITPIYQERYLGYTGVALALLCGLSCLSKYWRTARVLVVILCCAQIPAIEDSWKRKGKFGGELNTIAAMKCDVDAGYYGSEIARSVTVVEPHCVAQDPMKLQSGAASGTLFGTQRAFEPDEITFHGRILVVDIVQRDQWLARAEEQAQAAGCVISQKYRNGRFIALRFDCPGSRAETP